jgi:hypothetical protein
MSFLQSITMCNLINVSTHELCWGACNPYLECNPIKGASSLTALQKWAAGSSDLYLPVANPYLHSQQQHALKNLISFLIICVVTGGWIISEKLNLQKVLVRSDHVLVKAVLNIWLEYYIRRHTGLSSEVGRTFRTWSTVLLQCRILTLYCFVTITVLYSYCINIHRFFESFFCYYYYHYLLYAGYLHIYSWDKQCP